MRAVRRAIRASPGSRVFRVSRLLRPALANAAAPCRWTLSRLETGRQPNPTVDTFLRYASDVGRQLVLTHADPAATERGNGKQAPSATKKAPRSAAWRWCFAFGTIRRGGEHHDSTCARGEWRRRIPKRHRPAGRDFGRSQAFALSSGRPVGRDRSHGGGAAPLARGRCRVTARHRSREATRGGD